MSHFSRLPGRIVIPIRRHFPRSGQLVVSFAIAVILVIFATLLSCTLKGR